MTESQCREDLASKGLEADEINEIVTARLAKGTIVSDKPEANEDITRLDAAAEAIKLAKAKAKSKAKDDDVEWEAEETTMSGDDDDEPELGNGSMDPEPEKHRMDKAQQFAADLLKGQVREVVEGVVQDQLSRLADFVGSRLSSLKKAIQTIDERVDAVSDMALSQSTLQKAGASIPADIKGIKDSIAALEKAFKGARGDFRGATASDFEVVEPGGSADLNKADLLAGQADAFLQVRLAKASAENDDETMIRIRDAYQAHNPSVKVEAAKALGFTG